MNSKHVTLILFVLIFGGLVITGYNKLTEEANMASISPTPTPGDLFTGNNNAQNQQSVPQQQQQVPANKHFNAFPGVLSTDQLQNKMAVLETTKGTIKIQLLPEAPKTESNFIFLTQNGFYDGLTFHRVEPGFVIQGGDPLGNGTGGPGYTFEDEPVTRSYDKGIVAMANAGPNTNGSQFFIMLADHPELPKNYTIFGMVVEGQDVVDKIQVGDKMTKVTIQNFTPSSPISPTPTQ